jgi:hypothetical protein
MLSNPEAGVAPVKRKKEGIQSSSSMEARYDFSTSTAFSSIVFFFLSFFFFRVPSFLVRIFSPVGLWKKKKEE